MQQQKPIYQSLKGSVSTSSTVSDMVNHPPHYRKGKFETIEVINDISQFYTGSMAYSVGCVIKYISRAPFKGHLLEDLKKAQWYMNHLVSLTNGQ